MKILATVLLAVLFIIGGCSTNCDDDMADIREKLGAPEEVNSYDSSDYHSVSWWYWSKGVEYTFTWSSDSSCEVSTYRFDPIDKDALDKESAILNKVLIGTYNTWNLGQ